MSNHNLAQLALAGLLGMGALGCGDSNQATTAKEASTDAATPAAKPAAKKEAAKKTAEAGQDAAKAPAKVAAKATTRAKYTEVHDCAGKNVCKGLGGCHVDAAKLQKLKAKLAG